jgi:hypothetical protein
VDEARPEDSKLKILEKPLCDELDEVEVEAVVAGADVAMEEEVELDGGTDCVDEVPRVLGGVTPPSGGMDRWCDWPERSESEGSEPKGVLDICLEGGRTF